MYVRQGKCRRKKIEQIKLRKRKIKKIFTFLIYIDNTQQIQKLQLYKN